MNHPATMWREDFAPGQRFRTQGRTVTSADIAQFAALTWDTNPVHTDAQFAATNRFGSVIAHGFMGASFAMGLASRLGVFEGSSIALLGIDDWKFSAPVFEGDTLTAEIEILAVRTTSSGAGVLDRKFTLRNHNGVIVQSGRIGLMVAERPTNG